MKPNSLTPCLRADQARDHADGVHCSANVTRPAASFFISLRSARRRRDPSAPGLFDRLPTASPSVFGTRANITRPPQRSGVAPRAVEPLT